jgi:hypothetical protein
MRRRKKVAIPENSEKPTTVPDLSGEDYLDVLARIHLILQPKSYPELGTWTGNSLRLAKCPSIAVDSNFQISTDVIGEKPECHFFRMTSDDFFRCYSPTELLGRRLDFALIDAMHLFEAAIRDFVNLEQHSRPNSIIAIHDCFPTDAHIATRVNDPVEREKVSTRPGWWSGDVWKIVPILRKFRPDLKVVNLDAPPTGLTLVTNLYPKSTILLDRYHDITSEFDGVQLVDYGVVRLHTEANFVSTRTLDKLEDFGPMFWL